MPDLNPLEWGGLWLYGSFVAFALVYVGTVVRWVWDALTGLVRQIRDALAERRRTDSETVDQIFEPYSICGCAQCEGYRNPLRDKGGPS
jgi:hypothetical protein